MTKGGFVSFYARRAERFYGLLKKKSALKADFCDWYILSCYCTAFKRCVETDSQIIPPSAACGPLSSLQQFCAAGSGRALAGLLRRANAVKTPVKTRKRSMPVKNVRAFISVQLIDKTKVSVKCYRQ